MLFLTYCKKEVTWSKTKHSINCQNTVQILNGTALSNGITLTYYSSSSSDSKEDDSVKGTATKLQKQKMDQTQEVDAPKNSADDISWFVVLANGQIFEVVQEDLKNAEQYKVHSLTNNQFLPCIAENKKQKQQWQWRQQKLQAEKEKQFVVEEAWKEMTSFWKNNGRSLQRYVRILINCLVGKCTAIFKRFQL